jgi:tetratricopeptide (TPR) repeat protein
MKKTRLLFLSVFLLSSVILGSWKAYEKPAAKASPVKILPLTMCSSFANLTFDTTYREAFILPGLGGLTYKVSTKSQKAQEFFDQGLKLIYGFNHWEAIQSFRHATKLDPDCAMGYWGLALAYGPNLNDINPKDREKFAFDAIQQAKSKIKNCTSVEKDLILALSTRYNGKAYDNRDSLNQRYAESMLVVSKKYPSDPEVQTMAADAIMNTMPWDYWSKDGTPKPATTESKMILEKILKIYVKHPGANHLYIHLVEASSNPAQGLNSAKILETLMPGSGHLVHMPTHIYLRTGQYDRSIELNQRAVAADEKYLSQSENPGMYRWSYYPHNIDFISYSSYMEGRSNLGIQTAMKLAYKGNLMSASNPVFAQYFMVEPMIASVTFGKWEDILSLPKPDEQFVYANLIYRFARGMALARTNRIEEAAENSAKLDSIAKLDTLSQIYFSFNPISDIAKVPANLLKGEVLLKQKRVAQGLAALREAVAAEENLRYMEPPDWKIPSRHFLGAALTELSMFDEAAKVYQEDQLKYPGNGWSLYGLQLCQAKTGRTSEASATGKKLTASWKNADFKLRGSRF